MHAQVEAYESRRSTAKNFKTLSDVAIDEARHQSKKAFRRLHIVCGPISTGGVGDLNTNLKIFSETIRSLTAIRCPIFNQVPYEEHLFRLRTQWRNDNGNSSKYCKPLIFEFYGNLFKSGVIDTAWFIPGYRSSVGARWEKKTLSRLGVRCIELPDEWTVFLMKTIK